MGFDTAKVDYLGSVTRADMDYVEDALGQASLRHDLSDDRIRHWGELRSLEHASVASHDRIDRSAGRQDERRIPWGDC